MDECVYPNDGAHSQFSDRSDFGGFASLLFPLASFLLSPLVAQSVGTFFASVLCNFLRVTLINIQSYIIRTIALGFFFFAVVPMLKVLLLKIGLIAIPLSISGAAVITPRSYTESFDPYETFMSEGIIGLLSIQWEQFMDVFSIENMIWG